MSIMKASERKREQEADAPPLRKRRPGGRRHRHAPYLHPRRHQVLAPPKTTVSYEWSDKRVEVSKSFLRDPFTPLRRMRLRWVLVGILIGSFPSAIRIYPAGAISSQQLYSYDSSVWFLTLLTQRFRTLIKKYISDNRLQKRSCDFRADNYMISISMIWFNIYFESVALCRPQTIYLFNRPIGMML